MAEQELPYAGTAPNIPDSMAAATEEAKRSSIEKPPVKEAPAFERLPDEIIEQYALQPHPVSHYNKSTNSESFRVVSSSSPARMRLHP